MKEVIPLNKDVFCLVHKGGRADAYSAIFVPGESGSLGSTECELRWLLCLSIFEGEKVKMIAHLAQCSALLVVYTIARDETPNTLHLRVLDVPSILKGEVKARNCRSLTDLKVRPGGFIEHDVQNNCLWASDIQSLSCWDACSLERRFHIDLASVDASNIRFSFGFVGIMQAFAGGVVQVQLYDSKTGRDAAYAKVNLIPDFSQNVNLDPDIVVLELIGGGAILAKCQGVQAAVVGVLGPSPQLCHLPGTEDWEPDSFVFLPSSGLILALVNEVLEIWHCFLPDIASCPMTPQPSCERIAVLRVPDLDTRRLCIDEQLAAIIVARPADLRNELFQCARTVTPSWTAAEDLVLIDLLNQGGIRAALKGICGGTGGGGVAEMKVNFEEGRMILLSRKGALLCYATE